MKGLVLIAFVCLMITTQLEASCWSDWSRCSGWSSWGNNRVWPDCDTRCRENPNNGGGRCAEVRNTCSWMDDDTMVLQCQCYERPLYFENFDNNNWAYARR